MKRTVRRVTTISATVLALVAMGVAPANAATGNGNSVGTYFINSAPINFPPPCSVVYGYRYASGPGYTGTYTVPGFTPSSGPLTVTMTAIQTITYLGLPAVGFEGPEGIYDDPQCTIPDTNGWPAKATVRGSGVNNDVSCDYIGTYTRRASQATEWDMKGDCFINGSAGSKTREVHVGQLGECREKDGDAPPEECDETNTWVATNSS